jgi:predicted RNase H-like HicB family nuclease
MEGERHGRVRRARAGGEGLTADARVPWAEARDWITTFGVTEQNRETMTSVLVRSHPVELTAVLTHAEEGGFVALNPETGTTTQGETVEDAVANLKEATALYLSEFPMPSVGHPLITMFTVPEPVHA